MKKARSKFPFSASTIPAVFYFSSHIPVSFFFFFHHLHLHPRYATIKIPAQSLSVCPAYEYHLIYGCNPYFLLFPFTHISSSCGGSSRDRGQPAAAASNNKKQKQPSLGSAQAGSFVVLLNSY